MEVILSIKQYVILSTIFFFRKYFPTKLNVKKDHKTISRNVLDQMTELKALKLYQMSNSSFPQTPQN